MIYYLLVIYLEVISKACGPSEESRLFFTEIYSQKGLFVYKKQQPVQLCCLSINNVCGPYIDSRYLYVGFLMNNVGGA